MVAVNVPPEILDHIFSFLDNDPSTLKACSLATQPDTVLRDVVDRRLYAHIVLTNFTPDNPTSFFYADLFQYLSSDQQVANYIRTLQIEIEMPCLYPWYNQVSSILRMLPPTLEGITLSSRTTTPVMWFHLHETFRQAFLDCLWSPNLLDASIQHFHGIPLTVFNRCPKLQTLSFRQLEVDSFFTSDARFPPQLTSLIVYRSSNLQTILSWAKTGHNLRSLGFESDTEKCYPLLTQLFLSHSDTLINLELDFTHLYATYYNIYSGRSRHPTTSPPSLSPLSNLNQLTVWASIYTRVSIGVLDIFSSIPTIARFVATSPSLKRLILRVQMAPRRLDLTAKSRIWSPLVSLADHPSLDHIELGILPMPSGTSCIDPIFALMGVPELKQMCEKGLLSMEKKSSRAFGNT